MTSHIEKMAAESARLSFAVAAAAALMALAGCASPSSGEGQPSAAYASGGNVVGPRDTGTYPNLNIRPGQAAPQFTDDEAKAKLAALEAERRAARNPAQAAGARSDSASLRRLAASHGNETLRQIEGKCDPTLDPTCK